MRYLRLLICLLLIGCMEAQAGHGRDRGHRRGLIRDTPAGEAGPSFSNALSVNLDGTDEHLTCGDPTALDGVTDFTISLWLRAVGSWGTLGVISKTRTTHFELRSITGGALRLYLGASSIFCQPTASFVADTWYHVVFSYDGDNATAANRCVAYVDSVDATDTPGGTLPATLGSNDGALIIGATSATTNHFIGNIEEVAFWGGHTASALQAVELFNGGDPDDLDTYSGGSPDNWWRMGDGSTHPTLEDVGTAGGFNCTMTNTEADDIAAEVP